MKFDIALDNNRYPEKIGTTSTLEHLYPGASSKHNIRKRGIVRVTGQIPIYSIWESRRYLRYLRGCRTRLAHARLRDVGSHNGVIQRIIPCIKGDPQNVQTGSPSWSSLSKVQGTKLSQQRQEGYA
jgi:hypothetical protein